jgi:putative transcription antitermination factor YqgF
MTKQNSPLAGNILALDWGLKRIGVATSDARGVAITPRPLWRRKAAGQIWSFSKDDKEDLRKLIENYESAVIFLGEPRSLEGQATQASECAARLANKIQQFTGCRVVLVPETLTSWESRHESNNDSAAAALLIKSYFHEQEILK